MRDADASIDSVTLLGLQIVVAPDYRGRGLSHGIVDVVRRVAIDRDLQRLVIPIRPTHKHLYPLTPIDRYIEWERDGETFDP